MMTGTRVGMAAVFGLLFLGSVAIGADVAPGVYTWDGKGLLEGRRRLAAGDADMVAAVGHLRRNADKLLSAPLLVITEKKHLAPGGDPHDYVSLARYGWPDPSKPDGLPWITRDGQPNPVCDEYDSPRLARMCSNVKTLAVAYWYTLQEPYAQRAAQQIRAWFLDPATRMNPNLQHAQMMTGRNEGAAIGLIDTHELPSVLNGVALLGGSKAWTAEDDGKLKAWCGDFGKWLTESANGRREAQATNNHGTWYDVQLITCALYAGDTALAQRTATAARTVRLSQIQPDGRMPRELARTLSISYTHFNLEALFELARVARRVDVDLWNYKTDDGRSIRAAVDWLIPYATGKKAWEYQQINKGGAGAFYDLFRQAAVAWPEKSYAQVLADMPDKPGSDLWTELLYPAPGAGGGR